MKAEEPRVALVHDFLLDLRGAERVFLALCDMFPQADLFTASTTRPGPRGASRTARCTRRSCSGCTPTPRRFAATCRCIRTRWRRWTSAATTSSCRAPRRGPTGVLPSEDAGARLLLPQPVPLRVERPRGHAARPWAGGARGARRRAAALAPVGLDRRPARRPLHRQLGADAPARRAVLHRARPRSSTRPWRSSASRPATPGDHYVVLSELMPHKRIELAVRAFNMLRRPARRDRRRARRAPAAAPRGTDRQLHRTGDRRRGRAPAGHRPGAGGHRDRGVRHRRRRGAGRGPPGRGASTRAA